MEENKIILYYDGVCNLCNRWVRFVIKNDHKKQIFFSPLQSHPELEKYNSVVLKTGGRYVSKSDAMLWLLRYLGGIWKTSVLFYCIPKFLRDGIYDFVAARRHHWFGKTDACRMPSQEVRQRFLS